MSKRIFGAVLLAAALVLGAAMPAAAQERARAADEAAIRATALNYIEGWYEGDAARMQSALHPELEKRVVLNNPGGQSLIQMSAATLVESTAAGGGSDTPPEQQHKDVTILDIYGNAASVRIYASGWVDYLQMAKWRGEWKIVNVLYELHPE